MESNLLQDKVCLYFEYVHIPLPIRWRNRELTNPTQPNPTQPNPTLASCLASVKNIVTPDRYGKGLGPQGVIDRRVCQYCTPRAARAQSHVLARNANPPWRLCSMYLC
jgi:hypothetical protein